MGNGMRGLAALVCTLAGLSGAASAQNARSGLHDDASGTLPEVEIQKENLAFANASARLTFDVGYVYKSSTLVGEPLLLCGAELRNPQGTVSFVHRGDTRHVQVTSENAETINPHHVDLLVGYRLSDGRVFYASCDTGIVGTWSRDPFNLASSPSWDRFLCEVPGHISVVHHVSMQPRPNRLGRDWCARMDGRHLDAEQAKALFRDQELRASSFVVGSLSLNVADLVLEETRKLRAARVADRMEAQINGAMNDAKPGFMTAREEHDRWESLRRQLQDGMRDAGARGNPVERAVALRDMVRELLARESGGETPDAVLRAMQAAVAARISDEPARALAEEERRQASEADEERMRIAASVDAELQAAHAAAAAAPEFKFASEGGPADIVREIRRFEGWHASRAFAFSPDGRYIVSATNRWLRLWDAANGTEIRRFELRGNVLSAAFSPDGQHILTTDMDCDCAAILWDAANGKGIRSFSTGHYSYPSMRTVAFSSDGRHVLGGGEHHIFRWDAVSGNLIQEFALGESTLPAAFSPDGRYVLVTTWHREFQLWDAVVGTEIRRFQHESVETVAFSPDGHHILSGAPHREEFRLWDAANGAEVRRFVDKGIGPIAFSPDGRHVISAAGRGILLWDATTGNDIRRFEHEHWARVGSFSPDGRYAVSIDSSGQIILWGPDER